MSHFSILKHMNYFFLPNHSRMNFPYDFMDFPFSFLPPKWGYPQEFIHGSLYTQSFKKPINMYGPMSNPILSLRPRPSNACKPLKFTMPIFILNSACSNRTNSYLSWELAYQLFSVHSKTMFSVSLTGSPKAILVIKEHGF